MKKLFFRSTISLDDYRRFVSTNPQGIAENVFITRYDLGYKKHFREWLQSAFDANDKRLEKGKQPLELEITIKSHYDDRSVSANNLLWKALTLLSIILSKEGRKVSPQELYDIDMIDFAPPYERTFPNEYIQAMRIMAESGEDETGSVIGHVIEVRDNGDGTSTMVLQKTTSFFNTDEFSRYLECKLYELEEMGATRYNDSEVKALIDDFHKHLNKC